jgi:hypothetical protein
MFNRVETGDNSKSYPRINPFLFLLLFFFVHNSKYVDNSAKESGIKKLIFPSFAWFLLPCKIYRSY